METTPTITANSSDRVIPRYEERRAALLFDQQNVGSGGHGLRVTSPDEFLSAPNDCDDPLHHAQIVEHRDQRGEKYDDG